MGTSLALCSEERAKSPPLTPGGLGQPADTMGFTHRTHTAPRWGEGEQSPGQPQGHVLRGLSTGATHRKELLSVTVCVGETALGYTGSSDGITLWPRWDEQGTQGADLCSAKVDGNMWAARGGTQEVARMQNICLQAR